MLISHKKKFIFIHNYKVAGTSIRAALSDYCTISLRESNFLDQLRLVFGCYPKIYSRNYPGHISAYDIKKSISQKVFNGYYKFGFVRNPWDWQVSLYSFALKTKTLKQHELISKMKDFDTYIDWRVHEDLHLQKDFFYHEDKKLVDFVGKLENISNDFETVCSKLKLKCSLDQLNVSRKDNYKDYYSQKSYDMIAQAFKEDIDLFNYSEHLQYR